jgi:hypothetical protein
VKCDGYRILISEMLQGRLGIDAATAVASHMDACESCRSFHRELVTADRGSGGPDEPGNRSQEKPTASRRGGWIVAVAVTAAIAFVIGAVFIARQARWIGHGRDHRAGHHRTSQSRFP